MVKDMDEYQIEKLREEDKNQSSDDALLRKELKSEIDELYAKKNEGALAFLKLCEYKYKNWKGQYVKFKEEDLKEGKLKTTLVKSQIHYHPDKARSAAAGEFTIKDVYLRKEISKIINSLNSDMKGF